MAATVTGRLSTQLGSKRMVRLRVILGGAAETIRPGMRRIDYCHVRCVGAPAGAVDNQVWVARNGSSTTDLNDEPDVLRVGASTPGATDTYQLTVIGV